MMSRKTKNLLVCSMVASASAIGWHFAKSSETIEKPTAAPQAKVSRETVESFASKNIENFEHRETEKKNWIVDFEPLTNKEQEEVAIVHKHVKELNMTGRIDSDKMNELRGVVYKYQERIFADAGRRIILESPELVKSKEGADTVVTLIDTLAYFSRNSTDWPLAMEILRDIGTRPLTYSSTLSPEQASTANITMQAFEQFARYKPEEAMEFILTSVDKEKRGPYISYFKTGMALAGFSKDDIYQRVSRLI